MNLKLYLIFRMSLVWFIWVISLLLMVWFSWTIPRWLLPAVQQYWRLCRILCSSPAVVATCGPVAKGKATATAPDATDAVETGGGGGEGAGVDLGIVLQASDNEEVAPAATGDGGPGSGYDIMHDITV